MPTIFKIFLAYKAITTGWTYWFGEKKSLSKEDIDEFENSGIIVVSFLLYSPFLIPMYIFKGINYLINGSQKKGSSTTTHQISHLQSNTPPVVVQKQKNKIENKLECPNCHNKVKSGQKFCTNCGYDLSQQIVVKPAVEKTVLDTNKMQKPEMVNLFLRTTEGDFLIVYLTNQLLGLSLDESKRILDSAPTYLPGSYDKTVALKYVEELKKNGAIAEIRP